MVRLALLAALSAAAVAQTLPASWQAAVDNGTLLIGPPPADELYWPGVGNGYVGWTVNSSSVYVAGVFASNPAGGWAHRASFPPVTRVTLVGATPVAYGLDVQHGLFKILHTVDAAPCASVEVLHYAHQGERRVLVAHTHVDASGCSVPVKLAITTDTQNGAPNDIALQPVAPAALRALAAAHAAAVAAAGQDADAAALARLTVAGAARVGATNSTALQGFTQFAEPLPATFPGGANVQGAMVFSAPPGTVVVPAGARHDFYVLAAFATSIAQDRGVSASATCPSAGPSSRTSCGAPGIIQATCLRAGCCWDASPAAAQAPCYVNPSPAAAPVLDATAAFEEASKLAVAGALLGPHMHAWAALTRAGVHVGGNLALTRIIGSAWYYLLAAVRRDVPQGMSPGGLVQGGAANATDYPLQHMYGFFGSTFWDMDLWMGPALLPFASSLTAANLQYRADRLAEAGVVAQYYGQGGAKFPWQSEFSGLFAQAPNIEDHLTADVLLAARQYYFATGNSEPFLCTQGLQLALPVGVWLLQRLTFNATLGLWTFLNVQAPNEYAVGVDNNPFTNGGAAAALEFAALALTTCQPGNATAAALAQRFLSVAGSMFIPFNASSSTHPDYDGEEWGAIRKQADVALLAFPLAYPMPATMAQADLEYEVAHVNPNGPCMTAATFAVGYTRLAMLDQAAAQLNASYQANVLSLESFHLWVECPPPGCVDALPPTEAALRHLEARKAGKRGRKGRPALRAGKATHATLASAAQQEVEEGKGAAEVDVVYDEPCRNFITGAGGFLQALTYGYLGLEYRNDSMVLAPAVPPGATSISAVGLRWGCGTFEAVSDGAQLNVTLTSTPPQQRQQPFLHAGAGASGYGECSFCAVPNAPTRWDLAEGRRSPAGAASLPVPLPLWQTVTLPASPATPVAIIAC